jgi:hypothetical protein
VAGLSLRNYTEESWSGMSSRQDGLEKLKAVMFLSLGLALIFNFVDSLGSVSGMAWRLTGALLSTVFAVSLVALVVVWLLRRRVQGRDVDNK